MHQLSRRLLLPIFASMCLFGSVALAQPAATQPATTQTTDSMEAAITDFIAWADRTAALLHDVRNKETAQAAAEKLKNAPAETKALFARQMTLMSMPIDPAMQQEMQQKFGPQMVQSMAKLMAEKQRIAEDPTLSEALGKDLDTALSVFTARPAATTRPVN